MIKGITHRWILSLTCLLLYIFYPYDMLLSVAVIFIIMDRLEEIESKIEDLRND